jgi:hypothetical protein
MSYEEQALHACLCLCLGLCLGLCDTHSPLSLEESKRPTLTADQTSPSLSLAIILPVSMRSSWHVSISH